MYACAREGGEGRAEISASAAAYLHHAFPFIFYPTPLPWTSLELYEIHYEEIEEYSMSFGLL